MTIKSDHARIEGQSGNNCKEPAAYMDVTHDLMGWAIGVCFNPEWAHFVLAKKDGRHYLLGVPSERWHQDLIDAGYDVLQIIPGAPRP